jgi:tRNA nucleotidyltransferase (CCA-adding enzyme)
MAHSNIGTTIDPWGGYEDLGRRLIRCVRNPDDRFQEDALRILRALRFASTYGFKIEEKTAAAIHRHKDLLKNVSAERIQAELTKMLCGKGVLDILLEYSDVMAVIIPELEPCIGFEQNNPYHLYTVYDHIAHAVDNYKGDDISIKMALLLHDIGKPECYTEDHNGGHFHGHSVPSMRMAKEVMTRLKFDAKTRDEVIDLVLYHDSDIYPGTRSVKRWLNKIGYEMLVKLINIKVADIMAHSEINQTSRVGVCFDILAIADDIVGDQQCFQIKDLVVSGNDIMWNCGISSGPEVGMVLNHLLDMVLDETIENNANELIKEAKRYLEELHADSV